MSSVSSPSSRRFVLALVTYATFTDIVAYAIAAPVLPDLSRKLGASPTTFGLRVLARAHLEMGDAAALTATIDRLGRVGTELRWLPARLFCEQWRATRALLEGRFDEVGTHAEAMRGHERAYQAATGMLAVVAGAQHSWSAAGGLIALAVICFSSRFIPRLTKWKSQSKIFGGVIKDVDGLCGLSSRCCH